MRLFALRILAISTVALWLLFLSRSVSGLYDGGDVTSAILFVLVLCASIVIALIAAMRPNRLLAIILLVISSAPAAFLVYEFFSRLKEFGSAYFLDGTAAQLVSLYTVVPVMVVPFLWGVACFIFPRGS
jgi:hypothetical protein